MGNAQSGRHAQFNLHIEEVQEKKPDGGRGKPVSPTLDCCLDEEGHTITAQGRELAHRKHPDKRPVYMFLANWLSSSLRQQSSSQGGSTNNLRTNGVPTTRGYQVA